MPPKPKGVVHLYFDIVYYYNCKRCLQVGFRISPVTMEQHSGVFTCEAKARDGRVSTHHVMLHVNSQTAFVPPPVINRTLASHVTVGQDFTVACSVTVDLSTVVELTWKTPNSRAIDEGRIEGPQQSARNLSMAGTHLKIVEQVVQYLRGILGIDCPQQMLRLVQRHGQPIPEIPLEYVHCTCHKYLSHSVSYDTGCDHFK